MTPRERNVAKHCQNIIGSWSGSERQCDCEWSTDCPLSQAVRDEAAADPEIQAIKSQHYAEFRASPSPALES